jgi:fibronectin type 3 domain-containing protein
MKTYSSTNEVFAGRSRAKLVLSRIAEEPRIALDYLSRHGRHSYGGILFALVILGLLLSGNARAQIVLQDGGTNLVTTASSPISVNITVTPRASVLVVNLFDRNNVATLASPASLAWGSQTLTRVVAVNNGAGTWADSDIYYLINPTPGTGTITATDTSGGTVSAMTMQAFTLSGVDTTIPPISVVASNASAAVVSAALPGNTPIFGWAVVNSSFGASPNALKVSASSGAVNSPSVQNNTSQAMGYIANLSAGSGRVTVTNTTGATQKMAVGVAVFTPLLSGPAAPTGLTATGKTNQVTLSWADGSGGAATGYVVWRATGSGAYSAIVTNSGNGNVTYTDNNVVPFTQYSYVVESVGSGGAGQFSAGATASPFGVAPSAPNNFTATAQTNRVFLSWSDTSAGSANGYNVLRSITSGSNYIQIGTTVGNASTTFTDNGVYDGITYYYAVQSVSTGGTSTNSVQASAAPFFALPAGLGGSITLLDGGTNSITTVASGSGSTISSSFVVSQKAGVLVVELWDRNTFNNNSSPSSLMWTNTDTGTTQTLVRAVSEVSGASTYSDCNIYYLFNPTPGNGIISGTDTNTVSIQGLTMMPFTLAGVDTTVAPVTYATNGSSATTLSVTTAVTTPPGAWSAVLAYDGNTGQLLSIGSTSGAAIYSDVVNNQEQALGYVSGAAGGSSTISMSDAGSATKCALAVAVFMPAIGTGIAPLDGSIFTTGTAPSGAATITQPFAVSQGASVMVVALEDFDNSGPQGYPGATLMWSNITFGVTQPMSVGIATNSGQYGWIWTSLYYVMDPLPGTGVIIGVDTNGTPGGMFMQAYTLKGVDTTVTPVGLGLGQDSTTLSLDTPTTTVVGSAAPVMSINYNGGGGNNVVIVSSSGGIIQTNPRPSGVQCTMGIITNLAAGDTLITANATGVSTHMDIAAEIFAPISVLTAPTSVSATAQTNQIQLSWADSSGGGASSYVVLRSTTSGSGYTAIATNNGNASTTFTDTHVTDWTTYYYVVEAVGPGGVSTFSTQVSAAPVGSPASAAGVAAAADVNQVDLTWNNQLGADSFNVLRSTTSGSGFTLVGNSATNGFTDTAVNDGTLYYYEIVSSNSFGLSAASSQVSAVPVVTFFTNWIGIFNSAADAAGWTPLFANPSFYVFADAPPSGPSTECLIMDAVFGPGSSNPEYGITKPFSQPINISSYKNLELDIKNQTGWDQFGQVQGIQINLQVPVGGNPTYERGTDITLYQSQSGGTWTHYSIPLTNWASFNLSALSAFGINVFDGNTTVATEMYPSYANIAFTGAPGWGSSFTGLSNRGIGTGATSVTLTGNVRGTVAGTNVFLLSGTPITVTINGNPQATTINDATGDFSINYDTTGLANGTYPVTYAAVSDMSSLVGTTNTSTTLTVGVSIPPQPTIGSPTLDSTRTNLVLTVNTASGFNYYLLSATNLTPPVVWTTNSTTAGTGGPITNVVPITTSKPRLFLRYQVQ